MEVIILHTCAVYKNLLPLLYLIRYRIRYDKSLDVISFSAWCEITRWVPTGILLPEPSDRLAPQLSDCDRVHLMQSSDDCHRLHLTLLDAFVWVIWTPWSNALLAFILSNREIFEHWRTDIFLTTLFLLIKKREKLMIVSVESTGGQNTERYVNS